MVTPGDQTVTATADTQNDSITGCATVTVTDGGSPRMGYGNCWNSIVDQREPNFRNGNKPNWKGHDFDSPN